MIDVHFEGLLPWPVHQVARALRDLPWTFPLPEGDRPHPGSFQAELRVPVGAHGAVSHLATIEVGEIERSTGAVRVPITISASSRFPTFHGALEGRDILGDTTLAMTGQCRVPLGIAGRVGDAAAGGGMAQASLRRFFGDLMKALKADLEATAPPWRPAVFPESLREP